MREGWEIKKLSEIAEYFNGLTYSPKDVSHKGTIVLRSSNIQNDELDFSDIVRVNVNVKEKLIVKDGDILMCSRNGSQRLVGKTAPILNLKESMTFGTFMMVIRSEFSSYLLWFFKTDEFKKQISGGENTMINQVTRYMLDEIKIPLPPLPEQKQIVAIIDKAFAAIDKAKVNAEKNLQNAKDLFESYLQNVFEKKGDDWEEKTLGELADVEYGYTDNSTMEGDYRYIRITDIDKNGELILEDKKYIKKSIEAEKFILKNNDLLMARTGATFAKVLLYKDHEPSIFASYLIKIKFTTNVENELYWYFTKTKSYWQQATSLSSGAAQPHFNGAAVKQVLFSFPLSVQRQKAIIKQFQILSIETKKLEAIYQQKLKDLEELKKSILQKAFCGELNLKTMAKHKLLQD